MAPVFGDTSKPRAYVRAIGGRMRAALVGALTKMDPGSANAGPPRVRSRVPGIGAGLAIFVDPIAFQRRGHASLGEVFGVSLFGQQIFFVSGEETLARFSGATSDELDLTAAYRKMLGRLLGEDLFTELPLQVMRTLSGATVRRRGAELAAFAGEFVRARLGGGGTVDGLALANDLILHMSCRFICGDRIAPEVCAELARLFHVLESDFSVVGVFLPVETASMRRRQAARARILAIFEAEVRRAVATGAEADGYMQAVLEDRLGPEPSRATAEQVHAAALALMGAVFGAHTNTAMTFAASLIDLLMHPEMLAEVLAEQARVTGGEHQELTEFSSMPTLLRAINESLRLRGTGGLWRLSRQPVEIGGHTLPAGSLVGSMMGLINLDPTLYRDPDRYDPARYAALRTDELQSPSIKQRHFGAFGLGRHVCPGRSLAYVMVATALIALLRDYRVELRERPRRWFHLMTAGLARPVGRFTFAATRRG
jgi:sterol 14-demethylase